MLLRSRRAVLGAIGAATLTVAGLVPGVASADPLGSSGSSGSSGSTALPPGFPCIHAQVNHYGTWGWTKLDAPVAAKFVTGNSGVGRGYLDTTAPQQGTQTARFQAGISSSLGQLAANTRSLGFRHLGPTSFQLRLRGADRTDAGGDGASTGFTTLVWEPSRNGGASDTWKDDGNLVNGQWWSTRSINGQTQTSVLKSLPEISAQNPRAVVTAYGVLQTSTTKGGADDLRFGCARWNFEP